MTSFFSKGELELTFIPAISHSKVYGKLLEDRLFRMRYGTINVFVMRICTQRVCVCTNVMDVAKSS